MRAFEIPEGRTEQVAWLESELLGTRLPELVAELQAVHGRQSTELESFSDATLSDLRACGLASLSDEQFTSLLREPQRLVPLQQDVLEHGGGYWSTIAPPQDEPTIKSPFSTRSEGGEVSEAVPGTPVVRQTTWSLKATWAAVGALATAAVFALFFQSPLRLPELSPGANQVAEREPGDDRVRQDANWGFAKFANDNQLRKSNARSSREEYLSGLAKAAEAWTNKRPETAAALAKRLGEFRMGCSAIILAEHNPLGEADRAWLNERCRRWAAALDRHLMNLERGQSVQEVRDAVDSTVTRIAAALLGRADTPVA